MKALRITAIVIVVAIALAALLVGIALIPAVQTWAVRKTVSGQPGIKLDVSRVSAGFNSATLTDVRLVKNGIVITASQVAAKYSAMDYLRDRLTVHDLVVKDLLVDARGLATATAANTANPGQPPPPADEPTGARDDDAPFNGVLNGIELPFDVHITRFAVPGRALLPGEQTATFELRGSNITTGQRGTVDWKVDLANADTASAVRAVHASGGGAIHITTERRIESVELNAVAAVEGTNLPPDQFKLEAKIEQPAASGNERYAAVVSLVRGGTSARLVDLAGQFNAAAKEVSGAWNITVRNEDIGPILTGLGLPDMAVEGSGKFAAKPDVGAVITSGGIRGDITRLEKVAASLSPIGSLRVQTAFNGGLSNNDARLEQFSLDATTADGRKLAEVELLQRVAFSLSEKRVSFADARADLARISLQALPLAWAQPFTDPMVIESGEASMVLAIAAEADGSRVRVSPLEPLSIRNVTLRRGDQVLVEKLSATAKPRAEYATDRLQAVLDELNVTTAAGDAITGRINAGITQLTSSPVISVDSALQAKVVAALKPYLPASTGRLDVAVDFSAEKRGQAIRYDLKRLDARQGIATLVTAAATGGVELGESFSVSTKGTLQADLAVLSELPIASGSSAIGRGTLKAAFEANVAETIQAEAEVSARGLVARQTNQPLGDAELKLTATVQPDGSSLVKMPFVLTNGNRRSDLLVDGTIARTGNRMTINGRVTSEQLILDDLKPLAALAPTTESPATSPSAPSPTAGPPAPQTSPPRTPAQPAGTPATAAPDEKAFWDAFGGKLELHLKRVAYGRDYVIGDVRGAATITPTQLALTGLEGRLQENPFKMVATVDFNARQTQPYALAGTANVSGFDVGAFLRSANPKEPPLLESVVSIDARINGNGATLLNLAQNAHGMFDVTGSKGVLRALAQKGQMAVGVGSAILGIIGQQKQSEGTVALANLVQKLSALPFDVFTMHVERGADLNLKIGRFEFRSPDTRIVGSGGIADQTGVPIQNEPLQLTFSLAGKDGMAVLLDRLKLLGAQKDDLGYLVTSRTFTLRGTPASTDTSELWRILAQAVAQAALPSAGDALNRMLRGN